MKMHNTTNSETWREIGLYTVAYTRY